MASIPAVPSAAPPLIGGRPMISVHVRLSLSLVCLVPLGWSSPAWPAWPHDPLTSVRLANVVSDQANLGAVPDGMGGAYVAFEDNRAGHDIYLQRVAANGSIAPGWSATGLAVCTAVNDQLFPVAISDGAGGVYIVWDDARSGNRDI